MVLQQWTLGAVVVLSVVLFAEYGSCEDSTAYSCETPKQKAGACVEISKCPELLAYLQPGRRTSEDLIYLKSSSCGYEGKKPKICCPLNGTQSVNEPPTPAPWGDSSSSSGSTVGNEVDEQEPVDVSTSSRLSLLPLSTCGPDGQDKIINGIDASVAQFPWMALLGYETSPGHTDFYCGGTIINERYILTAAHCVTGLLPNQKLTSVRLGELEINNKTDCVSSGLTQHCAPPAEDYSIDEIIAHPNYSKPIKFLNDIALLRLNQTVTFKDHIRAICLPIGEEQTREFPASSKLIVSGWGITEKNIRSSRLQYTSLPVIGHPRCVQSYSQSKIQVFSQRQMCAGGSNRTDSCNGDSGGPLSYFGEVAGNQQIVQFGIVSFGPKACATNNLPGVYTKVGYYMDWILNTIRE